MIQLKEGVRFDGVAPELLLGFMVAEGIWAKYNQDLVITEIKGGEHGTQSFHYSGRAGDLRIRYFGPATIQKVYQELKAALAGNFDVILHSTHIHIEYQPRK